MCLAFPGKVVEVQGDFARVDFGAGTIKDQVNISLVQAHVGQYVLVHAGYAIQVVNETEAKKTIAYWNEILRSFPQDSARYEKGFRGGF
jgi:hydrogenase expression/formation protein HypC